jgi:hypothetical protein
MAESVADMINQLGPFGDFGIRNASIHLSATTAPNLQLVVRGSPHIPFSNNTENGLAVSHVVSLIPPHHFPS